MAKSPCLSRGFSINQTQVVVNKSESLGFGLFIIGIACGDLALSRLFLIGSVTFAVIAPGGLVIVVSLAGVTFRVGFLLLSFLVRLTLFFIVAFVAHDESSGMSGWTGAIFRLIAIQG